MFEMQLESYSKIFVSVVVHCFEATEKISIKLTWVQIAVQEISNLAERKYKILAKFSGL